MPISPQGKRWKGKGKSKIRSPSFPLPFSLLLTDAARPRNVSAEEAAVPPSLEKEWNEKARNPSRKRERSQSMRTVRARRGRLLSVSIQSIHRTGGLISGLRHFR